MNFTHTNGWDKISIEKCGWLELNVMVVLWLHWSANTGLASFWVSACLIWHCWGKAPPKGALPFLCFRGFTRFRPTFSASKQHSHWEVPNISVHAGEDDGEEASQWYATALEASCIKALLSFIFDMGVAECFGITALSLLSHSPYLLSFPFLWHISTRCEPLPTKPICSWPRMM